MGRNTDTRGPRHFQHLGRAFHNRMLMWTLVHLLFKCSITKLCSGCGDLKILFELRFSWPATHIAEEPIFGDFVTNHVKQQMVFDSIETQPNHSVDHILCGREINLNQAIHLG